MTDQDRNAFANLILLCHPHHTTVDKRRTADYSIKLLEKWKAERETAGQAALAGLRNVTEERLQELITNAVSPGVKQVQDAISRLEEFDSESARVLRDLIDQLTNHQLFPMLDEGIVNKLYSAGSDLRSLDEGIVNSLARASSDLRSVDESLINSLDRAARNLRASLNEDTISQLESAADKLRRARPDY